MQDIIDDAKELLDEVHRRKESLHPVVGDKEWLKNISEVELFLWNVEVILETLILGEDDDECRCKTAS